MTDSQRLNQMEEVIATMALSAHLLAAKTGWLISQALENATPSQTAHLDCATSLALLECADAGSPLAREAIKRCGLTAEDAIPSHLQAERASIGQP